MQLHPTADVERGEAAHTCFLGGLPDGFQLQRQVRRGLHGVRAAAQAERAQVVLVDETSNRRQHHRPAPQLLRLALGSAGGPAGIGGGRSWPCGYVLWIIQLQGLTKTLATPMDSL